MNDIEKKPGELARPSFGQQWRVPGVDMALAWIPPGSFVMGTTEPEWCEFVSTYGAAHDVTISKGFWCGVYEVTQAEWACLMGSNPSEFRGERRPVECVSWHESVEFCAILTARERAAGRLPAGYVYRLPTEAEWEYSCRAGTTTDVHFGDSLSGDLANFDGDVFLERTTDVGSYPPNAFGLYDMHGNVGEWCLDGESYFSEKPVTDPIVAPTWGERMVRGGDWECDDYKCLSDVRQSFLSDQQDSRTGFRVVLARDLEAEKGVGQE